MLENSNTNEYSDQNSNETSIESLGSICESAVNQEATDKTEFSDAQEFLEAYPVISVERNVYVYDDDFWHLTTRNGIEKRIYEYFNRKQDSKELKEIKRIAEALRYLSHQESFLFYSGEGNIQNFKNTAFNPVTGKKLPFSKEHYCLGKMDFDYDPNATCEEWELFLESIWGGCEDKDDRIKLLQEFMFLCLTNITKFQKMLFLYGLGANGKTVVLNVIRAMVGEHNVSQVRLNEMTKTFKFSTFERKLVNIESDAEYHTLSEGYFKNLVSGEHMRDVKPVVTMLIATNLLPKVSNNSHSYYRRVEILDFNKIFSEAEQDKNLFEKLKKELSGITTWALKARERLLKPNSTLTEPASSKEAKALYELENNHVKEFVDENVNISDNDEITTLRSVFYDAYCEFCKKNNYKVLNNARFGRELKPFGIETKKTSQGRFYTARIKEKTE